MPVNQPATMHRRVDSLAIGQKKKKKQMRLMCYRLVWYQLLSTLSILTSREHVRSQSEPQVCMSILVKAAGHIQTNLLRYVYDASSHGLMGCSSLVTETTTFVA